MKEGVTLPIRVKTLNDESVLKILRERKGLSQETLSYELQKKGLHITSTFYSKLERTTKFIESKEEQRKGLYAYTISVETAMAISEVLDCSIYEFLEYKPYDDERKLSDYTPETIHTMPQYLKMELGKKLKQVRKDKGYSLKDTSDYLCKVLEDANPAPNRISHFERGHWTGEAVKAMCKLYNVEVEDLLK